MKAVKPSAVNSHCCFKMGCRLRFFYSKGAFLVLLWVFLQSATCWSIVCLFNQLFRDIPRSSVYFYVALVPLVPLFAIAPLAGWLADAHYGNFKVLKFGMILLFFASVLACINLLIDPEIEKFGYLNIVIANVVYALLISGFSFCVATSLQLGLDQMPDASANNIISCINWLIFSFCSGIWVCDTSWFILEECALKDTVKKGQLFSIFPVVWMVLFCCTVFILAPKWLINEPKSPQSFKTIYRVLKFTAKHKAPLNRSALTYWEENVPSRINLGKSRYGGPFTTEQVEDVKTFFKIIVIHVPYFISATSIASRPPFFSFAKKTLPGLGDCQSALVYGFTWSPAWCAMLMILLTELVIYPLVKIEPPSLLRRIGITLFFILVGSIGFLVVDIVSYIVDIQFSHWQQIAYSVYFAVIDLYLLFSITLQFICAQSPYNMRGLLSGYSVFLHLISVGIGAIIYRIITVAFPGDYQHIIHSSAGVVLSLVGFVLHCLLAHWYKKRVRDESYQPQRVVEEVYDRYLSYYH